jgi:Na+-translocating ferredoxin:NAD+ oxidoreductase subunit E
MSVPVPLKQEYLKGLGQFNPVLKQALGLCPALAVTVTALNGVAMGVATTFVLVFSSLIVSLIRSWIPHQVRIPAHIVIIATFVTIVDLVLKARFPELSASLGAYIPLIVVNCLILGRQEAFASKNPPLRAVVDGLGAGSGFLAALFLIGGMREVLGNGKFLGYTVMPAAFQPWLIMVLPGGAFLALGVIMAAVNAWNIRQQLQQAARQAPSTHPLEEVVN